MVAAKSVNKKRLMNQAEWDEHHQMLDAKRIRLINQRSKLTEELERVGQELAQTRKEMAEHYTTIIAKE